MNSPYWGCANPWPTGWADQSAQTTIDIYWHLWPDSDERTRTAIDAVFDRPLVRTVDGDAGMAAERGL
jgi:hypothetical protein